MTTPDDYSWWLLVPYLKLALRTDGRYLFSNNNITFLTGLSCSSSSLLAAKIWRASMSLWWWWWMLDGAKHHPEANPCLSSMSVHIKMGGNTRLSQTLSQLGFWPPPLPLFMTTKFKTIWWAALTYPPDRIYDKFFAFVLVFYSIIYSWHPYSMPQ